MKAYLWSGLTGVGFLVVAACSSSSDDASAQGGSGGATSGGASAGTANRGGASNNGGASNGGGSANDAGTSNNDAGAGGTTAGASNEGGTTGSEAGTSGASGDGAGAAGGEAGAPNCLVGDCSTTVVRIPLTGDPFDGYVALATIGTQTFHLLVDGGSADLAVAGSTCTTCTGITPTYQPGATATNLNVATDEFFASEASWHGAAFHDHVALGVSSIAVDFSEITSQTGDFLPSTNSYQGVLGLGQQGLATTPNQALISALVTAGMIADAYAMSLCGTSGELWLGGYDPDSLASPLAYTPMTTQDDFDTVTIDGMSVGSTSIASSPSAFGAATIDNEVASLLLPTAVYTAFKSAVTTANSASSLGGSFPGWFSGACYTIDAVTLAKWPTLSLRVPNSAGGADLVLQIPPSAYLIPDALGDYCLSVGDYGGTGALLGAPLFLSRVLLVDRQAQRLGIATTTCP
jgi:hypothetical protein